VRDYCEKAGVEFTRCRPYRQNDQAWVEQKNGAVVRRTVGYRRFEGLEAAAALARLYAAMRLFVNFFQPSFKLAEKVRDGANVRMRYHPPATPCQRLLADARTNEDVRRRLEDLRATLDPVRLLQEIREAQQQLVEIADMPVLGETAMPTAPTLERFLSGLRTAWQGGEAMVNGSVTFSGEAIRFLILFAAQQLVRLSWRGLRGKPDHSLHVVNEIGQGKTDDADIEAHRAFLPGEDVLDRRAHHGLAAIGPRGAPRHWLAFGFLRWICERRPLFAKCFSLALER
jgi:hypothetical protein